jgi:hypothetical protein
VRGGAKEIGGLRGAHLSRPAHLLTRIRVQCTWNRPWLRPEWAPFSQVQGRRPARRTPPRERRRLLPAAQWLPVPERAHLGGFSRGRCGYFSSSPVCFLRRGTNEMHSLGRTKLTSPPWLGDLRALRHPLQRWWLLLHPRLTQGRPRAAGGLAPALGGSRGCYRHSHTALCIPLAILHVKYTGRRANRALTAHACSEGVPDIVHRVPAAAGDCIIFTEALTHGARRARSHGCPLNLKFTGLTQNLGRLYGSHREFPVKLLGQLANFGPTL